MNRLILAVALATGCSVASSVPAYAAATRYVPALVLAGGVPRDDDSIALLSGRDARGGEAAAYVCRGYTCDEPATSAEKLGEQLDGLDASSYIPEN